MNPGIPRMTRGHQCLTSTVKSLISEMRPSGLMISKISTSQTLQSRLILNITYLLMPVHCSISYFVALVQVLVDNTNQHAVQSGTQGWTDPIIGKMKAYLDLQILMGMIQLLRNPMYWSFVYRSIYGRASKDILVLYFNAWQNDHCCTLSWLLFIKNISTQLWVLLLM